MKLKTLAPAVLLFLFTACKKDKVTSCEKTMADIAGTYTVVKLEIGISGVFTDITNELEPCEKDDKLILNSNGTSTYQDLGLACDPPENSSGTWSIDGSGKMTIDDGGGSGSADISTATINSFDCTTLVLTGTDDSFPGGEFRLTIKK